MESVVTEAFLQNLPPFLPIGPRTDKSVGPGITTACDMANCCRVTMYKLIAQGDVKAVKMGRRTLIDTSSLLDLLSRLPAMKSEMRAA